MAASAVAKEAVRETFVALGIDIGDPDDLRHFRANMAFLWRLRKTSEKVGLTIILTIVTVVTGGALAVIWDAIRNGKG